MLLLHVDEEGSNHDSTSGGLEIVFIVRTVLVRYEGDHFSSTLRNIVHEQERQGT